MPLEPLDTHFEEQITGRVKVTIERGVVRINDIADDDTIFLTEEDLGKLMDKWMLARLAMNNRKTEGRYEKLD